MKDEHFTIFALLCIAALIAWWYLKGKPEQQAAAQSNPLPVSWNEPMQTAYASNPTALQPSTPADLTVNIGNQMAASLTDQYIPLFGFVGIAQGETYQ